MKLCTLVQLLPDTKGTLIAIHRWKQLLLSTHLTKSKRLMASPMFLYSYFLTLSEHLSCFFHLLANWVVWGDGKLVDQCLGCHTERGKNRKRKRRKVTNAATTRWFAAAKQVAALTMWHICHLKLGAHRSCQLPALLLFSHFAHTSTKTGECFSHAIAVWNKP